MPNSEDTADEIANHYSLGKILTIWALAAVPMPILAFVVAPAIWAGETWQAGVTVWVLLVGGMIWQFVLSIIILSRELKSWRWTCLKERLWLGRPTNPDTGEASYRLFWWLIPAFLFYAVVEQTPLGSFIGELILIPFPGLDTLPKLDLQALIDPELVGAWWLLGLAVVSCIFNYLLGEELLFRGVLLPKMHGVFGRWDWLANAVLFGLYHLHRPTSALTTVVGGLAWSLPSRRFRSIWFAIILHGFEGIFVLVGAFAVVSGLAFQ
ncbi:MAG: CPBP family intramembrane metalloprotease [Rhodobacter sp.]|nr:CPBP family intramembrane metalloprotease [Rhodobacter sp.]